MYRQINDELTADLFHRNQRCAIYMIASACQTPSYRPNRHLLARESVPAYDQIDDQTRKAFLPSIPSRESGFVYR